MLTVSCNHAGILSLSPQYSLASRDEDVLDYGVLSDADTLSKTFTLHNVNPVRVCYTYMYSVHTI